MCEVTTCIPVAINNFGIICQLWGIVTLEHYAVKHNMKLYRKISTLAPFLWNLKMFKETF